MAKETYKTSFAKKQLKTPKEEKTIEEARQIVLNQFKHPYGEVGLVNYTKAMNTLSEDSINRFYSLPPTLKNAQIVVEWQRKNMFDIYSSIWKIVYQSGHLNAPALKNHFDKESLTRFEGLRRGVMAVYFNDFLSSFLDHERMWLKNYKSLFVHLEDDFKRISNMFRSCKFTFIIPPKMEFKHEYVDLLIEMWKRFEFPISTYYNINFRFYIFTSSIPGNAREKYDFLNSLPTEFMSMICLIADDIPLNKLHVICNKQKCRGTFDPTKVKDAEGKFIKASNKHLGELLNINRPVGSSLIVPPVFIPKNKITDKLINYYSGLGNVILY